MAFTVTVLDNVTLLVAGCNLTGSGNHIDLMAELSEEDATTFGSVGWREVRGGQRKGSVKASGFQEFGGPGSLEYDSYNRIGKADPITAGVNGSNPGDLAWLLNTMRAKTSPLSGDPGKLIPWSMEGAGTAALARGAWLHGPATVRSTSGTGTAVQMSATGALQKVQAALHVLSVAGSVPTIDVVVESATASTFGTPTTRVTFNQFTAVGGELQTSAAGANAGTWYRAKWTISASGGEQFLFGVSAGIV